MRRNQQENTKPTNHCSIKKDGIFIEKIERFGGKIIFTAKGEEVYVKNRKVVFSEVLCVVLCGALRLNTTTVIKHKRI
jgi:hypothetical protein